MKTVCYNFVHYMYRPKEDQIFWNFLFSALFTVALTTAMWILYRAQGGFPSSVPVFDAVLMSFAAFRITRLIIYDKITLWFRNFFPEGGGLRGTICDLLACPWCVGFWGALAVSWFYFMFPWAWYVILFLALAGIGSLLQVTANLIGWKAEQLKRTTERL